MRNILPFCIVFVVMLSIQGELTTMQPTPALSPTSDDSIKAATTLEVVSPMESERSYLRDEKLPTIPCVVKLIKELDKCYSIISFVEGKLNTESAGDIYVSTFNEDAMSWHMTVSNCCGLLFQIGQCTLPLPYSIIANLLKNFCDIVA